MEKAGTNESLPATRIDTATIKQKKREFETIVQQYLDSVSLIKVDKKVNELELRFGTNSKLSRPISKIDYDNVVQQLYACGFKTDNADGMQILRIQNEYTDPNSGFVKMSNIRAEIIGTDIIKEYCRTNSLQKVIDMPSNIFNKLKFTQKATAMDKNGTFVKRLDMDDFNFRVSFQTEQDYNVQSNIARNIIAKWTDSKKMFRCMNRVRMYHPEFPIFADLSIVKMSKKTNRIPLPHYTIQEAGVFTNAEQYEIELEVDNSRVCTGTNYNTLDALMGALRKCIRIVLSGMQGTQFPISYSDKNVVLQSYMQLVHGEQYNSPRRILPKDFIGPASYTLQIENIVMDDEQKSNMGNIRKNYTVTDKADGDRKLLYIAEDGKLYMIDTNMNVIFTGAKTNEKTIYNSLIDGEHIKTDKHGNSIHLYAAFDVYYISKKSVRELSFLPQNKDEEEEAEEKQKKTGEPNAAVNTQSRLKLLSQLIELIKPESILESKNTGEVKAKEAVHSTDFRIKCKTFERDTEISTIFDGCSKILSNVKDGLFEYNTDGLIFTPAYFAVGANRAGGPAGPLYKSTWDQSFKWKPVEFNTIDFLVTMKKDKTGKDEVHHIFQEGYNLQGVQNLIQYKTLVLRCGFDERKHGYINPCQDILNDNLPSFSDIDNEDTYKPVPFQPTNPFDANACYCNILLKEDGSRLFMMTEENEYFEEDMIVEFKYVMTNEDGWKWVPLRVRYDKTAELRAGLKNYGNAYHVANNNWHSIHHPITDEMITTGQNIPEFAISEDVYYVKNNEETSTRSLRDFHNLFVKKNLIVGVAKRGDTLIDYAVGKAGDMSKWIRSNLSFVFGIDIAKDNIYNQLDGACARFLNARKKNKEMPLALFVTGNSGLNIRGGAALFTEKDKQITNAVFGQGAKDATTLGKGVYKQYGIAEHGFNVSSCQFAVHYFFENKTSFHEFIRNVAECTKLQGYFVGTCYDGKTVFNLLKKKENGEGISIFKNERKIYEITKMYDQTGFPDDDMSLGYSVNVYQESINQVLREYLVNFDYFIRIMEDYGFIVVPTADAKHMDMPNGTGLFSELFTLMENEVKRNPRKNADYGKALLMSAEEKRISFMNRYFMFKKIRNVDVKKMTQVILKQDELVAKNGEQNMEELEKQVNVDVVVENIGTVRKLQKPKLVLKKNANVSVANPIANPIANPVANPNPIVNPLQEQPVEIKNIITSGPPMKIKIKRPVQPPSNISTNP